MAAAISATLVVKLFPFKKLLIVELNTSPASSNRRAISLYGEYFFSAIVARVSNVDEGTLSFRAVSDDRECDACSDIGLSNLCD